MTAIRHEPLPKLGKYFSLEELCVTSTGLANVPDSASRNNLKVLVDGFLDPLREHLGRPVRVTSGFRSRSVNGRVGGAPNSYHTRGEAADFKVDGLDAHAIVEAIMLADLDYHQVIAYAPERGGHVHVTYRAADAARGRRQLLWAPAGTMSYVPYTSNCRPT